MLDSLQLEMFENWTLDPRHKHFLQEYHTDEKHDYIYIPRFKC